MRLILNRFSDVTSAERASTTEDDVGEQALPQVKVDAVDRVYDNLVDASIFLTYKLWVEENFGGPEPLWTQLCSVMGGTIR